MKTNKYLSFIMSSLVAMAYTSCSNSDDVIDTPDPVVKTYTMTVDAQKGSNGTRALVLDGTTLNSTWTAGDKVEVWTADGTTTKYGELSAESAGASTKLSGTLTDLPSNGESLLLKYLSPNYNSQKGTIASISENCDYSVATVKVTNIDGDKISTEAADFINQQAVVKFKLKDADGNAFASNPTFFRMTDGTNTVNLSIPAATYSDPNNGNGVLYVAFPASDASANITLYATAGDAVYIFGKTGITFEKGKYYGVTVKMKEAPVFSVSSTKKVVFSPGNLQYDGTNWKFAEHQWQVLGANGTGDSGTANTYPMDLFTWGYLATPAYNGKDYVGGIDHLSGDTDWGHVMGEGWSTPTYDEWKYVFFERNATTVNETANARFAKGQVGGVHGLILFPDTYTHPDGVTLPVGINNDGDTGWNGNDYNVADWAKMEAAGCVFLPAAGSREGGSVYDVGYNGRYWHSTAKGSTGAGYFWFYSSYFYGWEGSSRYFGLSVRLVR